MSSEKTTAIILKVVDYSETSCVITLFSESSGKLSGLAKGARRPKGPFHGAIDVLSISQVLFLPRRSANLDLLTEAKLVRRFRPCQWSLARLYAGYYVAELLLETLEPHAAMPELFHQTVRTLDDLQQQESDWGYLPTSSILLRFELQLLQHLGQGLELNHCGLCGRPLKLDQRLPEQQKVKFSYLESSLVCSHCLSGKRQLVDLPLASVQLLRQLQASDDQRWRENAEPMVDRRLRDLLDQHWRVVLNRKLKLQPAIRQIVSREQQQAKRNAKEHRRSDP